MKKTFLLIVVVATVLLLVPDGRAQEAKVQRVGIILQGGPWYAIVVGLREGLKALGLTEGKQFTLDIHDTRGDLKAVEDTAKRLEQQKVDLIYTAATSVSLAAERSTVSTPIVFVAGTDPVAIKLVETISRPGGRLTGVHFLSTDLTGKRLELLKQIIPNLRRVVTFYNPNNPSAKESAKVGREAAPQLGLDFIERHVASREELEAALRAFGPEEADAYIAVSDAMVDAHAQLIINMSKANRLPTMFYEQGLVESGGLASYSTDFAEAGRLSARHVQQILSGANPKELPVEQVDRLAFIVNLKTAREIGLTIPDAILIRANGVVE